MTGAIIQTDGNRVDSNQIDGPGDHVAKLFQRRVGPILGHISVRGESDDPFACAEQLDCFGCFEATGPVNRRAHIFARVGMGNGDRTLRKPDGVQCRLLASMGQVDHDADAVHFLDGEIAKA